MKTLSIARKTLLEYLREPLLLGLLFLFPLLFLGFYYLAFGETDQGLAKYLTLWVINEDDGGPAGAGAQLVQVLRGIEFEGEPVFDVTEVTDRRAAEISLRERKISLLLQIPPGFSQALQEVASGEAPVSPVDVSLVGDSNTSSFVFARIFVEYLVRQFVRRAAGWGEDPVAVTYEFLPGTGTMSDFEFGVPGVIVFGIMFVAISTAHTLVRENVTGTLHRLRLSCVGAGDLLLGVTLAQIVIALFMVPFTFGAALLMGFEGKGSLLLAVGVGLLLSLAATGVGLVVACFARDDGEAANLSATVAVMMVLLSGAAWPMPDMPLVTLGGRAFHVYDLLPTAPAAEAMRRVLILGDGIWEIGYELAALTVLSATLLAAGITLYRHQRLRRT